MYVLQSKADHKGSKIPFTDFRWIGPNIVEKALPSTTYLVRKVGMNKIQVVHRFRLRLFKPRKHSPDVQTTSQEWKPDPEVTIRQNDLYTRAWESENGTPIFDKEKDEPDNHNSPEITVRHDLK